MKRLILVLLMILLIGFYSFSQEREGKLRVEVVKLKYIKSSMVRNLLFPLLSKEGMLFDSPDGTAIIIKDYPEIVEKCLAMIKDLDVKPFDLLFTIQLVLGSESERENIDKTLQDDSAIKEIKNLLRYNSFSLLDTKVVRITEGKEVLIMMGKENELELYLKPRLVREDKSELIMIAINLKKIEKEEKVIPPSKISKILISTEISVKPGERTVVGVSRMDKGEKGLIFIISGKVIG